MKRSLALLAAALLAAASLAIGAYALAPAVDRSTVLANLEDLADKLQGKYFTVDGEKCYDTVRVHSGCDNCYNESVYRTAWFREIFGDVSANNMPRTATYPRGWSCSGFATFAMWYAHKTTNDDLVTAHQIIDHKQFGPELLAGCLPGDLIRMYAANGQQHSIVYFYHDNSTVTYIDCNGGITEYNGCVVKKRTERFSMMGKWSIVSVWRADNYAPDGTTVEPAEPAVEPTEPAVEPPYADVTEALAALAAAQEALDTQENADPADDVFDDLLTLLAGTAEPVGTTLSLTIDSTKAFRNGEPLTIDVPPVLVNERTMLPARLVAESFGAAVSWDAETEEVCITEENGEEIRFAVGAATATVGDATVILDAPAFERDGRTYVPVRFLAEALDATVTWDEETQTVNIIK